MQCSEVQFSAVRICNVRQSLVRWCVVSTLQPPADSCRGGSGHPGSWRHRQKFIPSLQCGPWSTHAAPAHLLPPAASPALLPSLSPANHQVPPTPHCKPPQEKPEVTEQCGRAAAGVDSGGRVQDNFVLTNIWIMDLTTCTSLKCMDRLNYSRKLWKF